MIPANCQLNRNYQSDLEEFGHVDFKSEMVNRAQGGGHLPGLRNAKVWAKGAIRYPACLI